MFQIFLEKSTKLKQVDILGTFDKAVIFQILKENGDVLKIST